MSKKGASEEGRNGSADPASSEKSGIQWLGSNSVTAFFASFSQHPTPLLGTEPVSIGDPDVLLVPWVLPAMHPKYSSHQQVLAPDGDFSISVSMYDLAR